MHVALIGGGLANGLIALRLLERRGVTFELFEAGEQLGGNHTWSFHASDVTPSQLSWLQPMVSQRWQGHDVAFNSYQRTLSGEYLSIRSSDFDRVLRERLGDRVKLRTPVRPEAAQADVVIDSRGFSTDHSMVCGYQKFLGLELRLAAPHGLTRPLIMDCRVEQHGAFRFVYLLPWSERELLVEDTYYADSPHLDRGLLGRRIEAYVAARGWRIERIDREESAALPIPLSHPVPQLTRPTVGVAAGFFHATTGYSLPFAAAIADLIAADAPLETTALTALLQAKARDHHRSQGFFRLLNRMLFKGAEPNDRVKIFEAFYRHDEALVGRFYAGRLTTADVLKVLARGATTVPGPRALKAALGR